VPAVASRDGHLAADDRPARLGDLARLPHGLGVEAELTSGVVEQRRPGRPQVLDEPGGQTTELAGGSRRERTPAERSEQRHEAGIDEEDLAAQDLEAVN